MGFQNSVTWDYNQEVRLTPHPLLFSASETSKSHILYCTWSGGLGKKNHSWEWSVSEFSTLTPGPLAGSSGGLGQNRWVPGIFSLHLMLALPRLLWLQLSQNSRRWHFHSSELERTYSVKSHPTWAPEWNCYSWLLVISWDYAQSFKIMPFNLSSGVPGALPNVQRVSTCIWPVGDSWWLHFPM